MVQCPGCGAALAADAAVCAACGRTPEGEATSAPPTSNSGSGPTPGEGIAVEALPPGSLVGGRYRLLGLIGRGAMGEVYRADDLKLGQVVALKFLPAAVADNASALQRFISEVKLGRQVSHPNVCRLYDLIEVEGRHALSMEYIDGEDLATRIARRGALPAPELVRLAADLCAGLGAAHDRGVVHRDLKPANVLVDRDGRAHIADFGIAALAAEARQRDFSGTLAYMAPEQLAGQPASARSDLFAMGLVLYEAATGKRRYGARDLEELKAQHAAPDNKSREALRKSPAPLLRLLAACLKIDPAARPHDAAAAAALLGSESWLPRPRQLAAAVLVLLVLVGGLGWLGWKRGWIAAGVAAGAPARLGPASAAVLPFANLSGEKRDEYFSDGMSDTLLDRLSQVPQLRIAARTSSFAFKGKSATVQEIGAALGVAALVEGSVQRQGDTLRISAELIRVADGTHLWSKHFDRKAKDLFAIQDEIANAVTTELVGKLLPSSKAALSRRGTDDLEAYQQYLQGHQGMFRVSMDAMQRAEKHLRSAVDRDPHYVAAMLDLVQCWGWQYSLGAYGPEEFQRRAGPMLDRVDALEPGNARVLALRGWLAQTRNDDELAQKLVDRAVALAPDDYGIRINAAGVSMHRSDYAGALRHQDRMIALDPLNAYGYAQRSKTLEYLRRLDEAEAAARHALRLSPDDLVAMSTMANVAVDRNDLVGGLVWAFRIFPHNSDPGLAVAMAFNLDALRYFREGDAWMQVSRRLQPEHNVMADSYEIDRLLQQHQDAAAVAATVLFVAAQREHWELRWDHALLIGCLAAHRSGELAQLRSELQEAGFLPARFDSQALLDWAGPGEPGRDKLDRIFGFGPCAFDASPADAVRRQALRAAYQSLPPAESREWTRTRDARLANDREAMAVELAGLPATGWYLDATAAWQGIGDDRRVRAHRREVSIQEARAREQLPGRLAKVGLSMLPPPATPGTAP
jgi:serine/threonine-protein kinase